VVSATQNRGDCGTAARCGSGKHLRKYRVRAATLSDWRGRFLAAGAADIQSREASDEDEEYRRLRSVVASLSVETELLREKIALMEKWPPFVSWKSRA
jgi:hypothetical protein